MGGGRGTALGNCLFEPDLQGFNLIRRAIMMLYREAGVYDPDTRQVNIDASRHVADERSCAEDSGDPRGQGTGPWHSFDLYTGDG